MVETMAAAVAEAAALATAAAVAVVAAAAAEVAPVGSPLFAWGPAASLAGASLACNAALLAETG